jgi:hypothetical protein
MPGVKSLIKLAQIKLAGLCQEDPTIFQYIPDEFMIPVLARIPLSFQREYDTWATKIAIMGSKYRIEIRREDGYTTALIFKRNESKCNEIKCYSNHYKLRSKMTYFGNKRHGIHEYIRDDTVHVYIYYNHGMAITKTTFYADGSFRSRSSYGHHGFSFGICEYIKYNPDRTIKTYWYKGRNNETLFQKQIRGTYLIKNSTNVKIQKCRWFKQKREWISCPFWFFSNIESHL